MSILASRAKRFCSDHALSTPSKYLSLAVDWNRLVDIDDGGQIEDGSSHFAGCRIG